jgi:pimeloyl-ACP methyl ester carboxylesterase
LTGRRCGRVPEVIAPAVASGTMQSRVVSVEVAEERRLIPHAAQIDVAEAGHMVTGDDNDVFTTGLLGFLESSV